jgi:hypothetical protein
LAYVIDATALEELACRNKLAARIIGKAIETGKCYITAPTVATAYYAIWEREGEQAAETWLDYATSNSVMKLTDRSDPDFLRQVAMARSIANLPLCSRYAAALARSLDAQVITALADFEDLLQAGFCRVLWIG